MNNQTEYSRLPKCLLFILFLFLLPTENAVSQPNNIIFFIGDGMGFEQVKAAGMYANGVEGALSFETFPYQAELTTYAADSPVTDSAAAATAIATGIKVNNGVISRSYPGDGSELETLLEYFKDMGKMTGLVTTTAITHATPASFGAHVAIRSDFDGIASYYLNQTLPNVLFGGGGSGMTGVSAEQAGYIVVTDRNEMLSIDTENLAMVCGLFGNSIPYEYDGVGILPHLSEMTSTAIAILDNDPDGFFLMVEGGLIDWAGHSNDIIRNIFETMEFANAVEVAADWARDRTDTLIMVTADHETGGLDVLINNGQGNFPIVTWSTTGHTATNVPIYAWGKNAELVSDVMDNTDLFYVATGQRPQRTIFISNGGRRNCFIATAAFESPINPYVKILQEFRRQYLLNNDIGKFFLSLYDTFSPPVADYIRENANLRVIVRTGLLPIIGITWFLLNYGFLQSLLTLCVICLALFYSVRLVRRYR